MAYKYDAGQTDPKPTPKPTTSAPSKSKTSPPKPVAPPKPKPSTAAPSKSATTPKPKPKPTTGKQTAAGATKNAAKKAVKKFMNPKSYPKGSDTRWALEMTRKGFSDAEIQRRGKKRFGPDYGPA